MKESKTSKRMTLLTAVIAMAVAVSACGAKESNKPEGGAPANSASPSPASGTKPAAPKTVKDAMGHEVTIPAQPKRIIASYLEDPLLVLGEKPVAQWMVPNGTQKYLEKELSGVPPIPSTLPPETVLGFNPDLLLISNESSVEKGLYEQYSKIAPTYVLGSEITNDWRQTLRKIAELLNKTDVAEKALADYEEKAKATREKIKGTIGDKSAAILWLTKKNFYVVNGKVASGAVLYGDLGMKAPNILAVLPEAKANWVPISLEKLAVLDADFIFLVNSDKGQAGNLEEPLWRNIPAVKTGRIYEFDRDGSWLYNGLIAGSKVMDDLTASLSK
ncbi:iron-hydroxamate ABC transporter substrate-binding protein [Paenibacillus hodogayensis]|uniref:Iron-hydroxamate ABC transporter substrate-binding protein n=1 Tax=Paenibacillus hodogayensis TaxID=279208 RepID=A0ABV5W2P5_9BACL